MQFMGDNQRVMHQMNMNIPRFELNQRIGPIVYGTPEPRVNTALNPLKPLMHEYTEIPSKPITHLSGVF